MVVNGTPDAAAAAGRVAVAAPAPSAPPPPPPPASVHPASRTAGAPWLDRPTAGRVIALGLAVVASVVCTWGIATPWPWSDEGATYLALQRGWTQLPVLWQGPDAPMVPYYYLAKSWVAALGSLWPALSTLVAVRLLSAAAGVATVVALYALVARNAGRLAGVLAGLVLLSLPGFIRYAQEGRPYALLALAATISWLLGDLRLRPGRAALGFTRLDPTERTPAARPHRGGFGAATAHALSLAAVGVIHSFGALQWPAQLLAWLVAPGSRGVRGRRILSILVTLAAAAVLAGGQLLISAGHGTGPEELAAHRLVDPATIGAQLLRGISATYAPLASALVLLLALVGLFWKSQPGGRHQFPLSLLIWLVVPLGLGLAVGVMRTNLFRLRYWIAFLPPLAALAALGLVAIAGLVAGWVGQSRPAGPASGSPGARMAAAVTVAVLLTVHVVAVLPAQRHVRAPGGHSENLAGVFAAIAATRAEYPGVRVVITKGNGTIGAADPALMADNPLSRIHPAQPTVYSTPPSAASVRDALAGQRYLLWIYRGTVTSAEAAQQIPAALADLHPTVLHATPAGKAWTAVLLELPG
ncbi:MAG: hypothetical protein QM695_01275 [Micropruina sp.]